MTTTRRRLLSLAGSAALTGVVPASIAWAAPLEYRLDPVEVAEGIWLIEGANEHLSRQNGGAIANCVLIATDLGIVIVDPGPSLRFGEALRKRVQTMDPRGVAAIVNTHHHPDHFFGNQAFSDKPIYALGETIDLARTHADAFSDNMYRLIGDWMRGTEPLLPNEAINSNALTIGGRTLRILALGGHSEADLALEDLKTGALIAGDLVFYDRAPTTPHADLARWNESLTFLEKRSAPMIIPGHGPADRAGAAIAQTRDYLGWLERTLQGAARDGLDMVEIMGMELPDRFAALGAMPQEFQRSVVHLYPDVERAALPLNN